MESQRLVYRPATAADLDFLLALRRQTMRAHIENSGLEYREEEQVQRVLYQFGCAQIVIRDGAPVGLVKVDKNGRPWLLIQIQLLPAFQGRGLGRDLITELLTEATRQGTGVELTVLQASPAQRFYQRLGFCLQEKRPHSLVMRFDPEC
ncbi:MAG: GNAT family N-acetyltransferase [Candidatus Latescibacteria bacterium]|nr:GNAT family N-acetyltransferase [Candidatus Latescibacterota bacterium]